MSNTASNVTEIWYKTIYPSGLKRLLRVVLQKLLLWYVKKRIVLEVKGNVVDIANKNYLICANHQSHLDSIFIPLALKSSLNDFVFFGAKDYFYNNRYFAYLVTTLLNIVPFDRGSSLKAFSSNASLLDCSQKNRKNSILYPEGTRSLDGEIHDFKPGAIIYASMLGLEILPIRISGAYNAFPKGSIFFINKVKVTITIGTPIRYNKISSKEQIAASYDEAKKLRQTILAL